MVQSYLEGVGWGLEQLREARAELHEVSQALKRAGQEFSQSSEGMKNLERLREVSVNHRQLLAAVSNLPRLYSGRMLVCGATVIFKSDHFCFLLSKNIHFIFIIGPSIRKNIDPRSLTAEFILKDCLKDVELMFTVKTTNYQLSETIFCFTTS